MINAGKSGFVAVGLAANRCSTVAALIDDDVDAIFQVPSHNDRRLADEASLKIAKLWNFRLQADVVPCRAAKNALLFQIVIGTIEIYPIGNTALALGRP